MNKYYNIEILKRFMSEDELADMHEMYEKAKVNKVGRKVLSEHPIMKAHNSFVEWLKRK